MSKTVPTDLTASGEERPGPLALIDVAVDAARAAGHTCRDEVAREHIDFALAFLRESWIAESGQQARTADQVIADKQWVSRLFAAVCGEEARN